MRDIQAFWHLEKRYVNPTRPYCWRRKGYTLPSTHPYCWRWKGIHTTHPYCWWWKGIHGYNYTSILLVVKRDTQYTPPLLVVESDTNHTSILLAVKWDTYYTSILLAVERNEKSRNTRMPEYQKKVSPASAFVPVVSCFSPASASAFRHQGSVRYSWSWISPALSSYGYQQ
jgi:hypothetical protein